MTDLRLYANDLIGKVIKPRHHRGGHHADYDFIISKRKYVIEEVYPYYVRCREVVHDDREYVERECFNIGDLVLMGLIHSTGQRESSLQAKGIREPHGHSDYERWKERRWTN